mgnify:CR=1 FL=1
MPFTINDLRTIYEQMASHDHFNSDSRAFSKDSNAYAGALEMSDLFDVLSEHYAELGAT